MYLVCRIEGCDRPAKQRGKCRHHHNRVRTANNSKLPCHHPPCLGRRYNRSKWCMRHYELDKKYDLSPSDYDDLIVHQRGACAVCGTTGKALEVDHDHEIGPGKKPRNRGAVRGLVCRSCNALVARYEKGFTPKKDWLIEPIRRYVNDPPARKVLAA